MSAPEAVRERLRVALLANGPALLAYLERRVEIADDAADVLSETMLVAWRRAAALPADPIRARMWLFVTARNCLSNHARSARRREALTANLKARMASSARAAAFDADDDARTVRDAVDRLPADQRELVALIHWDGFSIAEAAQLTGTRPSTARTRYAVARAALKVALDDRVSAATPFAKL